MLEEIMRCACCLRLLNPANAFTAQGRNYGPTCAIRLGITKPAPKLKRKPSRFAIFKQSQAVKVDEFQDQLFEVIA